MERFSDLSIILKSFPYQERDRIAVCLTEHHGKITGLAKGAIGSRRFAGSLDLLTCSKIHVIQKPHTELARIEEASVHHEFKNIQKDFEKLTLASFAAEFCLRMIEPGAQAREIFVCLSNMLFQLDQGMHPRLNINAFLCKTFQALGYPPNLFRCVHCSLPAHQLMGQSQIFWSKEAGGMACSNCVSGQNKNLLQEKTLLLFHKLVTQPYKDLKWDESQNEVHNQLYQILSDFLHHHIPGVPPGGFRSWTLLNEQLRAHSF